MIVLIDHPWVQWLALWLAKILRMLWCLNLFGISGKEMDSVRFRILEVVGLDFQHPMLGRLIKMVHSAIGCLGLNIPKRLPLAETRWTK